MEGANRAHSLVKANLQCFIHSAVRGRSCYVMGTDMRIKVLATGLYTYPDLIVVCGEPLFEDDALDTLLNPNVLFEILSDTTEAFDRGAKASMYRRIPSLQEYIVVAQSEPLLECFIRQRNGNWLLKSAAPLTDALTLDSLNVTIPLSEIYRQVEFPPVKLRAEYPRRPGGSPATQ